jgi:hypothetical protein
MERRDRLTLRWQGEKDVTFQACLGMGQHLLPPVVAYCLTLAVARQPALMRLDLGQRPVNRQ